MSSSAASAPRTSAWSSASSSRIMPAPPPDPEPGGRRGRRPSARPSASARRRSPRQALPAGGAGRARRPVVDDLHAPRGQPHRALPRPAVPHHVGHRLPDRPARTAPAPRRHLVGHPRQLPRSCMRPTSASRAAAISPATRPPTAQRGGPHVGQRVAGQRLDPAPAPAGPLHVHVEQPLGQLAFTATTVSEWPRMSCRSRRSGRAVLATAISAISSRAPPAAAARPLAGSPSGAEQPAAPPARTLVVPARHHSPASASAPTTSTTASGRLRTAAPRAAPRRRPGRSTRGSQTRTRPPPATPAAPNQQCRADPDTTAAPRAGAGAPAAPTPIVATHQRGQEASVGQPRPPTRAVMRSPGRTGSGRPGTSHTAAKIHPKRGRGVRTASIGHRWRPSRPLTASVSRRNRHIAPAANKAVQATSSHPAPATDTDSRRGSTGAGQRAPTPYTGCSGAMVANHRSPARTTHRRTAAAPAPDPGSAYVLARQQIAHEQPERGEHQRAQPGQQAASSQAPAGSSAPGARRR